MGCKCTIVRTNKTLQSFLCSVYCLQEREIADIDEFAAQIADAASADLSKNQIVLLDGIQRATKLESLSLRSNYIGSSQASKVNQLPFLRALDVSQNSLEGHSLPIGAQLPRLAVLLLAQNQLYGLAGLEHLKSLKVLIADSNRIANLSSSGSDHHQAQSLGVGAAGSSVASIAELKASLASGPASGSGRLGPSSQSLIALSLRGNPIRTARPLRQSRFPALRALDLDGCRLDSFECLEGLGQLEHLSARCCGLRHSAGPAPGSIPPGASSASWSSAHSASGATPALSMPLLQTLRLDGNRLGSLLPLSRLHALRHLSLAGNCIRGMKDVTAMGQTLWPHLVSLDVSSNQIRDVPSRFAACVPALESLTMRSNELRHATKLAASLRGMPSLSLLDMRENPCNAGLYESATLDAMHESQRGSATGAEAQYSDRLFGISRETFNPIKAISGAIEYVETWEESEFSHESLDAVRIAREVILHPRAVPLTASAIERQPTEASSLPGSRLDQETKARQAGYRAVMIAALSSLQALDGRRITEHERDACNALALSMATRMQLHVEGRQPAEASTLDQQQSYLTGQSHGTLDPSALAIPVEHQEEQRTGILQGSRTRKRPKRTRRVSFAESLRPNLDPGYNASTQLVVFEPSKPDRIRPKQPSKLVQSRARRSTRSAGRNSALADSRPPWRDIVGSSGDDDGAASTNGQPSKRTSATSKSKWRSVGARVQQQQRNEAFFAKQIRDSEGRPGDVLLARPPPPKMQPDAVVQAEELLEADDEIGQHAKGRSPRRQREMDSSQVVAGMQSPAAAMTEPSDSMDEADRCKEVNPTQPATAQPQVLGNGLHGRLTGGDSSEVAKLSAALKRALARMQDKAGATSTARRTGVSPPSQPHHGGSQHSIARGMYGMLADGGPTRTPQHDGGIETDSIASGYQSNAHWRSSPPSASSMASKRSMLSPAAAAMRSLQFGAAQQEPTNQVQQQVLPAAAGYSVEGRPREESDYAALLSPLPAVQEAVGLENQRAGLSSLSHRWKMQRPPPPPPPRQLTADTHRLHEQQQVDLSGSAAKAAIGDDGAALEIGSPRMRAPLLSGTGSRNDHEVIGSGDVEVGCSNGAKGAAWTPSYSTYVPPPLVPSGAATQQAKHKEPVSMWVGLDDRSSGGPGELQSKAAQRFGEPVPETHVSGAAHWKQARKNHGHEANQSVGVQATPPQGTTQSNRSAAVPAASGTAYPRSLATHQLELSSFMSSAQAAPAERAQSADDSEESSISRKQRMAAAASKTMDRTSMLLAAIGEQPAQVHHEQRAVIPTGNSQPQPSLQQSEATAFQTVGGSDNVLFQLQTSSGTLVMYKQQQQSPNAQHAGHQRGVTAALQQASTSGVRTRSALEQQAVSNDTKQGESSGLPLQCDASVAEADVAPSRPASPSPSLVLQGSSYPASGESADSGKGKRASYESAVRLAVAHAQAHRQPSTSTVERSGRAARLVVASQAAAQPLAIDADSRTQEGVKLTLHPLAPAAPVDLSVRPHVDVPEHIDSETQALLERSQAALRILSEQRTAAVQSQPIGRTMGVAIDSASSQSGRQAAQHAESSSQPQGHGESGEAISEETSPHVQDTSIEQAVTVQRLDFRQTATGPRSPLQASRSKHSALRNTEVGSGAEGFMLSTLKPQVAQGLAELASSERLQDAVSMRSRSPTSVINSPLAWQTSRSEASHRTRGSPTSRTTRTSVRVQRTWQGSSRSPRRTPSKKTVTQTRDSGHLASDRCQVSDLGDHLKQAEAPCNESCQSTEAACHAPFGKVQASQTNQQASMKPLHQAAPACSESSQGSELDPNGDVAATHDRLQSIGASWGAIRQQQMEELQTAGIAVVPGQVPAWYGANRSATQQVGSKSSLQAAKMRAHLNLMVKALNQRTNSDQQAADLHSTDHGKVAPMQQHLMQGNISQFESSSHSNEGAGAVMQLPDEDSDVLQQHAWLQTSAGNLRGSDTNPRLPTATAAIDSTKFDAVAVESDEDLEQQKQEYTLVQSTAPASDHVLDDTARSTGMEDAALDSGRGKTSNAAASPARGALLQEPRVSLPQRGASYGGGSKVPTQDSNSCSIAQHTLQVTSSSPSRSIVFKVDLEASSTNEKASARPNQSSSSPARVRIETDFQPWEQPRDETLVQGQHAAAQLAQKHPSMNSAGSDQPRAAKAASFKAARRRRARTARKSRSKSRTRGSKADVRKLQVLAVSSRLSSQEKRLAKLRRTGGSHQAWSEASFDDAPSKGESVHCWTQRLRETTYGPETGSSRKRNTRHIGRKAATRKKSKPRPTARSSVADGVVEYAVLRKSSSARVAAKRQQSVLRHLKRLSSSKSQTLGKAKQSQTRAMASKAQKGRRPVRQDRRSKTSQARRQDYGMQESRDLLGLMDYATNLQIDLSSSDGSELASDLSDVSPARGVDHSAARHGSNQASGAVRALARLAEELDGPSDDDRSANSFSDGSVLDAVWQADSLLSKSGEPKDGLHDPDQNASDGDAGKRSGLDASGERNDD